jgi:hypothetical protein
VTIRRNCALVLLSAVASAVLGCVAQRRPAYEDRSRPATQEDLRLLDRASEILSDESRWNRNDTRECPAGDPTLSLFCALRRASVEILGEYDHRRVALQEVRFAIEDLTGGREFEHRLMDFNNLPDTTFQDIKKVLALARSTVADRLAGRAR